MCFIVLCWSLCFRSLLCRVREEVCDFGLVGFGWKGILELILKRWLILLLLLLKWIKHIISSERKGAAKSIGKETIENILIKLYHKFALHLQKTHCIIDITIKNAILEFQCHTDHNPLFYFNSLSNHKQWQPSFR